MTPFDNETAEGISRRIKEYGIAADELEKLAATKADPQVRAALGQYALELRETRNRWLARRASRPSMHPGA